MPKKPDDATDEAPEVEVEVVEEPTRESNNVLDEPEVEHVEPFNPSFGEVGQFVGRGVTHVSTDAGEWLVDPETGRVTGSVS